jgi:Peptidase family M1 domain
MTVRRGPALAAILAIAVAACSPAPTSTPVASATPTPTPPAPIASATLTPTPRATPSPTPEPTPASAILPGAVDRASLEIEATYDVALSVAVATGAIHVGVVIEARNDSGAPIDRLELNTIAARLGGLDVKSAEVDDRPVVVEIDDQTLIVPLGGILPAGASTTVVLSYTATLRSDLKGSDWLFSRAGGTLALYRWIPWVSRAVPFDRPNHGDPFVTPSSPRVRVFVTTDLPMELASAGTDVLMELRADGMAWTFEVADVRDVAIVLAPDFEVTTGDAGGIPVRAYTRPGGLDGDRLVAQASRALEREAERLGVPYPWPSFTVVETAGGYGMESPGLIWIPRGTASGNLPYLVHHETAHQWFYGLVGNDQQAEPFADEAAADLLARTVLGSLRGSRCDRTPLDRSIVRYSQACYYEIVYIQGGNVLDDLREAMGTDRFWAALRDYAEANRFGLGGTRELLEALRAASPVDLAPTLRARFPDLY